MEEDRNIKDVIEQMLAYIPDINKSFRDQLFNITRYIHYTPPELQPSVWNSASKVINKFLPRPDELEEGWQKDVVEIWCGREPEGEPCEDEEIVKKRIDSQFRR